MSLLIGYSDRTVELLLSHRNLTSFCLQGRTVDFPYEIVNKGDGIIDQLFYLPSCIYLIKYIKQLQFTSGHFSSIRKKKGPKILKKYSFRPVYSRLCFLPPLSYPKIGKIIPEENLYFVLFCNTL